MYFLANPSAHPLLNWGPVTMLTLTLDWMHCKYLGWGKLFYGGVLHVIIYKLLSGTAQENMVQTWNLLKKLRRSRYTNKISCTETHHVQAEPCWVS